MKEYEKFRDAIIRMHERGTGVCEIGRLLGINKATVSRAIQRFEETGSNIDRPGRGRKRSARSRENIRKIKAKIQRNPSSRKNSTRKIAPAYGISPKSIFSQNLGCCWQYRSKVAHRKTIP